jgi:LPS export ABC transporter permease LptG/LPS export ABC transporter permease LptF
MLRLIDRYIIRSVLPPLVMSLLVFTFILVLPFLIGLAEKLISKGVPAVTVLQVMVTLIPQALAVTIPMALLTGLLIGLGRFSGDREWVALQACGVSLGRVLRPVIALALVGTAATLWVLIWAVPDANQSYREITYRIVAQRAEGEVRPRVFFEDFPNRVLYVRDTPKDGVGWIDVFLADTTHPDSPTVYLADRGRMLLDREQRTVELVLEDGTQHTTKADSPGDYKVARFQQLVLSLDPDTVFPKNGPQKGDREMTIAELTALMKELRQKHVSTHNAEMEIQKKFSIPVACLVFGLLGAAFGFTNRRDGKLASFVQGLAVIFVYYMILANAQSAAKAAWVPARLATWVPDIVLGAFGVLLLAVRGAKSERWQSIFSTIGSRIQARLTPLFARRADASAGGRRRAAAFRSRVADMFSVRANILDRYIGALFLRVFLLTFVGLLGIFQISTFIDLSDKLFKGTATGAMVIEYMWYATPQYTYYCIPLAVLIGGLVTIGILMKNSELIVMRACGISLYRTALPVLLFSLVASGALFLLEENVLAYSNRRAEALNHVIRGGSPQTFDVLNRKWIVGRKGEIYNYLYFDPRRSELHGFSVFRFAPKAWRLQSRSYYKVASFPGKATGREETVAWTGVDGWVREFDRKIEERVFKPVPVAELLVEPPQYFTAEQPDADRMTYQQLSRYIAVLRTSGFNVMEYEVALHRKVAFPWVTLIMTFIAVPFAVTTGRRGAMYGIGLGIVLAILYWIAMSVFAALGAGGILPPLLAAWAPNILFAAAAVYLLLTVQT